MITEDIQAAAEELSKGGVVAFPTETVYGLGASALDPVAVSKVFALKGRPSNNPLIVHVSSIEMAQSLVREWPESATQIAGRFWPGPLTMVLPKAECVPDVVTGGGDSVAIRMPDHGIALLLIDAFGGPIVGPSANQSGAISPTLARHVIKEFGSDLLVLDGGPCTTGIESTVIRVGETSAEILRPGVIGALEIAEVVEVVESTHSGDETSALPSPGMLTKHYAPNAETRLVEDFKDAPEYSVALVLEAEPPSGSWYSEMPRDPEAYAARLYAALREADALQPDLILIERPKGIGPIWDAVRDRLRRASAGN